MSPAQNSSTPASRARRARRRAVALLSLSLLAAGCSRGCGCESTPPPQAKPDAAESGHTEVLNEGKEPRAAFQIGRWTGMRYELVFENSGSFGLLGDKPFKPPTGRSTWRYAVLKGTADPVVKERGGREFRLVEERAVLHDIVAESQELIPPALQALNAGLAKLKGTSLRQLTAEDGELYEVVIELVGGVKPDEKVKEVADENFKLLRRFPFRLPPISVGVGAKWRFSEPIEFHKVRAIQIADMELKKLDDKTGTIRIRIRHQAPRQEIPHPIDPADTAMLERYRGDAEGELVLDRLTGIPISARITTTASLQISGNTPQGRKSVTFNAANVMRIQGRLLPEDAGDDFGSDAGEALDAAEAASGDAASGAPR